MLATTKYLSPALYAQYSGNHGHERPACVQEGTWGADFYGDLRLTADHASSSSTSTGYSAFIGTRLDQLLRTMHSDDRHVWSGNDGLRRIDDS